MGRSAKPEETILPYYLGLRTDKKGDEKVGKLERIYLQDCGENLLCFVRSHGSMRQSIDKQDLIRNIRVIDKDGNLLRPIDQDITNLFLRSFTLNIHKLNEVSRSSLLEKVASILLDN